MPSDSARTSVAPPPDKGPFPEIPGYHILGRVGVGAMGTVYRAQQVAMDRTVALKVLFESLAGDRDFVSRFLREARSAAKLNHPNIVQAYDVGCMGNSYYLAMEFVDGESVGQVLDREKRLDEGRALAIVRSVALALDHAWQNGIVHRDVKPDNILLTRTGKAKLADLGLARSIERRDRLTALGTGIGTPDYMSPEQVRGEADLDIRSDIYSLGATLYNMLTGAAPYDGPTALAVGAQHCTEPPPDPRAKAPGTSDAAADLVLWMMAKKPSLRPQTPEELLGAIDAAFPGLAAPRPGSSTLPIPHRGRAAPDPARGNRWLVPALAALAALLALALAGVLLLRPPAREQGKRPLEVPDAVARQEAGKLREATDARARAEEARKSVEAERDRAIRDLDAAKMRVEALAAANKQAERDLASALKERDDAKAMAEKEATARKSAESAREGVETERDKALKDIADATAMAERILAAAEKARDDAKALAEKEAAARKRADEARKAAESERDKAQRDLGAAMTRVENLDAARKRAEAEAARLRALMRAEAQARREPKVYVEWPFGLEEAKRRQDETAKALNVKVEDELDLGSERMKLVLIPAGEFMMGDTQTPEEVHQRWPGGQIELYKWAHPRHRVKLTKPFYIGECEVTRGQFAAFAREAGPAIQAAEVDARDTEYKTDAEKAGKAWVWKANNWAYLEGYSWRNPNFQQTDRHPAVCISWNDAVAFCEWASKKTGKSVTLPTEAQWECACRAGCDGIWSWGDKEEDAQGKANVADEDYGADPDRFRGVKDGYTYTAPTGSFSANGFGLKDMLGNAQEWCSDWAEEKCYDESPAADPRGPADGRFRVFRGGAWGYTPRRCRSACRGWGGPSNAYSAQGFRVVVFPRTF